MSLREMLAGGGSIMPGDIKSSYAGDAYLLSKGFYPLAGGIVSQAENPILFNSIKHKNYFFSQAIAGIMQFQEATYIESPYASYDGDDIVLIAAGFSSSFYYTAFSLSTGNILAGPVYMNGGSGSYANRVARWTGTAFYVGNGYGEVWRIAPGSLSTKLKLYGGQFPYNSWPAIHDILELNGYVYVANGEGIFRALLTSNLAVPSSWTKVYAYSFLDLDSVPNETPQSNFVYDSISNTIFFTTAKGYGARSTNGGASWVDMPIPTSKSKIVRWGSALYLFERNGATGTDTVVKSVDSGITWATASMRLVTTAKTMQPIVKNDILYYAAGNGLHALFSDKAGLQDPSVVDHRFNNVAYLGNHSGNLILPANDAIGFRGIRSYMAATAGFSATGYYFTPGYDMATQFKLPVQPNINNIPQYIKAG